jgi:hypothetical protein
VGRLERVNAKGEEDGGRKDGKIDSESARARLHIPQIFNSISFCFENSCRDSVRSGTILLLLLLLLLVLCDGILDEFGRRSCDARVTVPPQKLVKHLSVANLEFATDYTRVVYSQHGVDVFHRLGFHIS